MPVAPSIVVGTDFSKGSQRAVSRARRLAERLALRLVSAHVVDPAHADVGDIESARSMAARQLGSATAKVASGSVMTPVGSPWAEIGRLAQDEAARLIVLGVHQPRHDIESFFLGSTAERVLRSVHCAMLLARLPANRPYRRALVAVDLHDHAPELLSATRALLPDTTLEIVHCVSQKESRRARAAEHALHRHVTSPTQERLLQLALSAGLDMDRHHVHIATARDPRHRLLELAKFHSADVIAMGTHARTGLNRLLIGSCAEYVVRAAGVDVLVVPPK